MFFSEIAALSIAALVGVHAPSQAPAAEPRLTIEQLTSIFENDTPELQFTYCQNIHDRRGLTFGFAGFTSGTYDGTLFLEEYQRLGPGNPLVRYLPAFRKIDAGPHDAEGRNPSTAGLSGFAAVFRSLGGDAAFVQAQQNLVDRLYWGPSQRIARHAGARLPITRGEFYDACINHGEDGLQALVQATNRALGGSPRTGIPERKWLAAFFDQRLALLRADSDWRRSTDRVKVYQHLLARDNVRLARPLRLTCYGDHFVLP
jgi:chitosanase